MILQINATNAIMDIQYLMADVYKLIFYHHPQDPQQHHLPQALHLDQAQLLQQLDQLHLVQHKQILDQLYRRSLSKAK